ncbi:MAG: metalloregulator ArsR/SmtB family transcription factor [Chloroflexi bacterium]|nr:metalloregulator ArsR/SmtB family transcription factor [Chloroflexota bacterium]
MQQVLRAIAEPRRLEILRLIQSVELPAGKIASNFNITRPAISQHLRVLKVAGLISERRQGTTRFYRARPKRLDELRAYLEQFWDERLQVLAQEAEMEERRST